MTPYVHLCDTYGTYELSDMSDIGERGAQFVLDTWDSYIRQRGHRSFNNYL